MKSLFNYKGIQFGKITKWEAREGIGCQCDVYYNGLLIGTYTDEAHGGETEFHFNVISSEETKKYLGVKKQATMDDTMNWRSQMKKTLLPIIQEYLKEVTPGNEYSSFFGESCYLRENPDFEQFMTEFCESYINGLALIEKDFKSAMRKFKTDEILVIIVPEYFDMGDTEFINSFKTITSANPKMFNADREKLSKDVCAKYDVKKVFFVTLKDFIVEAGVKNA